MTLEQLAKQTSYTSNMQRYFLACVDEFGEDFKQFIGVLCQEAYNIGYEDATPINGDRGGYGT